MPKPAILVIDDDTSITTTISNFLRANGYAVTVANDSDDALKMIAGDRFSIILSDIYIDRLTGIDILRVARERDPEACVILMTARGSVSTTVDAEAGGAFDYLAKPFDLKDLLLVIERGARSRNAPDEGTLVEDLQQYGGMIGFAPSIVEVYKRIARSAKSDETVLILGESGVGKELVARAIHDHSARSKSPFVAVDSGAVAGSLWEAEVFGALKGAFTGADRDRAGLIESARCGSIFFDEIGEIPHEFQAKLLRFLQEKEFRPVGAGTPRKADVRVLAATNRNLDEMVLAGTFREDLLYRLNVLRIEVPPLRDRRADIPFLIKRFLDDACENSAKRSWFEADAGKLLAEYDWPGNVRQLQSLVRRLVAMESAGAISAAVVQRELEQNQRGEPGEEITELDAVERKQILKVLKQTGGNKTKAAEILGIQRRTLYKKLARMEIGAAGE
ncbi:MAG: sigma-54-dependent Fis family transcriptional regulator [Bryobacterales bacterium]|nr:sigma-54-dependent Fis family transcriptional regulator [Bryobacterales bacterium]